MGRPTSDHAARSPERRSRSPRPGPRLPRRSGNPVRHTGPPADGAFRSPEERDREQETRDIDHVVFFSDAVIAIAITLLALKIELPEDWANGGRSLGDAIGDLAGNIVVFLWSFLIVGNFWIRHRQVFRNIVRLTGPLVGLNILFLALIALLPFPADVLGGTGVSRASIGPFAASTAAAGVVLTIVWLMAYRDRRLVETDWSDEELVREGVEIASLPAAFLLALIVATFSPAIAAWC